MTFLRLTLSLALVSMLLSCSKTPAGDASISMQDRREFEELKYRDPSTNSIPENVRARELAFAATLPGSRYGLSKEADVQAFGTFKQLGPYNVGGRTRALVMDVNDPKIMLAGGVSGGIWRTTDAGQTWTMTSNPEEIHTVTTIWQDKVAGRTNEWYYGTGEAYGNSARISGNGLWKSTDGGLSWRHLKATATDRIPASHAFAYCWRVLASPSGALYVATTRAGIQRSTDGGTTWESVLSTNSFFSDLTISDNGVLYAALSSFTGGQAASRSGFFRSEDGVEWTDITPADIPTGLNRCVIGMVPNTDNFYAIAETPGEGTLGVFRLSSGDREQWHSLWKYEYVSGNGSDAGGLWDNRSENIPLFGGRNGDFFSQGGYDLLVRVSPHDTDLVIVGGTNLYRSTDGFQSSEANVWIGGYGLPKEGERFPRWPNQHPDQHEVLFHPSEDSTIINGNDGGVYLTTNVYDNDTVKWESLNNGYFTTQHYAIAIRDTAGDDHVLGGMQDNGTWEGTSGDATQPWNKRGGGDGAYCFYADSGRSLYGSTQRGRIRRVVLNEAEEEIARTRVDPAYLNSTDYLFINPYVIDPNAEEIMYQAGRGMLWRNNDLTQIPLGSEDSTFINWDSLEATRIPGGMISAVAASVEPADVIYYGTTVGKMYRLDDASQNGSQPLDISKGLAAGAYINSISIDKRDAMHVLATFTNYGVISIFESVDGGVTWLAISGNLEENRNGSGYGPAVNWVEIVPFDDEHDIYLAATTTGLYFCPVTNGMSTVWTQVAAEEIGNVPIDMLLTRYSDKRIFVGTHGRGVFTGTIDEIPATTDSPMLSMPANGAGGIYPDTTVSWLPVDGAVSYSVEISTSSDFATDVTVIDGIQDTIASVGGLVPGPVAYYWRVVSFAGGGASEPSETWSFSSVIAAPDILSPDNGAEGVPGLPVALQWSHREAAVSYDYEVGSNISFNPTVAEAERFADTTAMIGDLASGTRYFWHVRARDADTFGLWSQRRRFTTGVLTSVQEESYPTFGMAPNPASNSVALTLPPDHCQRTVIEIIDRQGKAVLTKNSDAQSESNNGVVEIDVRALPAGSYVVTTTCDKKRWSAELRVVR